MCNSQGQVGLWLPTNMALFFPLHLLSLFSVACFYFFIRTCIFIPILRPMSHDTIDEQGASSNKSQHPIFDYLFIGGVFLLTLSLAAIHNPVLVFYRSFVAFAFAFLSLAGKAEWIIHHFSLFVSYRPLMGLFISRQNTYPDLFNSDSCSCDLYLAPICQLMQRSMDTLPSH